MFKRSLVLAIAAAVLSVSPLYAQSPDNADSIRKDLVSSRLEEARSSTELNDTERTALISLYTKTLDFLEQQKRYSGLSSSYREVSETRQQKLDALDAQLADIQSKLPLEQPLPDVIESSKAGELLLQQEKAQQASVTARLSRLNQRLAEVSSRAPAISQELLEAGNRLDEITELVKQSAPGNVSTRRAQAYRWSLTAESMAIDAAIEKLNQELVTQPIRLELLEKEKLIAKTELNYIQQRIEALQTVVQERRRNETEELLATIDDVSLGKTANAELIKPYIEKVEELKQLLTETTESISEARGRLAESEAVYRAVNRAYKDSQQRLEIAGMNKALGRVMHEQRRDLPSLKQLQRRAKIRAELISEVSLQEIRLEADGEKYADPALIIESIIQENPDADTPVFRRTLLEILEQTQVLLKSVRTTNSDYLRALAELEFSQQKLLYLVAEADEFLKERLLWVRNQSSLSVKTFSSAVSEFQDLFLSAKTWEQIGDGIYKAATANALLFAVVLISVFIWIRRGAIRARIRGTSASVNVVASDSIGPTLQGLFYTLCISLPAPLLMYVSGTEIVRLSENTASFGFGTALHSIAYIVLVIGLMRSLCIDGGVGMAHLGWPAKVCSKLRADLRLLLIGLVLPALLLVFDMYANTSFIADQFGRVMFMIAVVTFIVVAVRMLRPDTGYIWEGAHAPSAKAKPSWLWAALVAAIPAGLIIAASTGYMYAAATLMGNLLRSIAAVSLLAVLHDVLVRWLLVTNRKLLLQQAIEERKAQYEAMLRKRSEDEEEDQDTPTPPEEPKIDLQSLDSDTRKLINTGVFVIGLIALSAIWSEVFVAFNFFREITLWTYLSGIPGEQELAAVTLTDLIFAIFVSIVTYVSAKTIPSLIDVLLRTRTHVGSGARLAYTTLFRYALVIIGIATVSDLIGFQWSNVQWLVAALGVGIGFGLQEIVANFISGLIILVERPVRVGDVVTVGNVSGTVSRIQIRATTVTNFDRQELLVPNREFIANQVLNWSLSDDVLRLMIPVGVAYGTDIDKAMALMEAVAQEDSRVIDDPKPFVTFDEFGDNSLLLTLRAYVGSPNKRFETVSRLNVAINKKFRENGIVVAFPQRDVHLDTSKPLDIRLSKEPG